MSSKPEDTLFLRGLSSGSPSDEIIFIYETIGKAFKF